MQEWLRKLCNISKYFVVSAYYLAREALARRTFVLMKGVTCRPEGGDCGERVGCNETGRCSSLTENIFACFFFYFLLRALFSHIFTS